MVLEDYTPYQQRIIKRYYGHRQELAFQKLEEMVADIYLAETEKKKASLWKRIEKALVNLQVPEKIRAHILEKKDPGILAKNLKDWWASLPKEERKPEGEGPGGA
jgi:hypothetical protein